MKVEIESKLKGQGGVYELRHIGTGTAYVGSTKDLASRKADHYTKLAKGKHSNHRIQRDYDLCPCGNTEFAFTVLSFIEDRGDRFTAEQEMIDTGTFTYNISKKAQGGGNTVGAMRKEVRRYITPWGEFRTIAAACEAGHMKTTTLSKIMENLDRKVDRKTFRRIAYLRAHYTVDALNRTWRRLGFGFTRDQTASEEIF
ncbi:GIY-YIG nuclease family protein [Rhizobium sp. CFBP 8752]|uniref:GIY-YIG nuclease family protein n=1 Tax=Rhizobium sp. CFBP 8752 TaxID=2775301 RepID=UPI00177A9F2B|nr:GIY-YIG nuclease family protein [Rhizobium sp. CFBP 8752]MBD8663117.1 GIY-YIG nuclease family protein [Rhizobium sp. CFBP 8752]